MLTLNDGRSELWQWDTGRKLNVGVDCSQVHFSNKVFGRSVDVDVVGGTAIIPDFLLQTDKDLLAWAYVGSPENGYTKISKVFKVNRRNKPSEYVFTPVDQMTMAEISAIAQNVRDDADAGLFNGEDGATFIPSVSYDGVISWTNDKDLPNPEPVSIKGKDGMDGVDGKDGTDGKDGYTPKKGVDYFDGKDGKDGTDGQPGKDGYTPKKGVDYNDGADGKSAYAYAKEGGFTGTEEEFAAKLAEEYPTPDWNAAEGEPGHILNRTHYDGVVTILPQITVTNHNPETMYECNYPLQEGNTYTVTWNSDTYSCVAVDVGGVQAIGNMGIMGGEDSGEPFLIMTMGTQLGIMAADEEFTVSITGKTTVRIPEKFLPERMKTYTIEVTSNDLSSINGVTTMPQSFDSFINHLYSGGTVTIKTILIDDDGQSIIQVSNITNYVWTYVDDGNGEGPVPVVFVDCPSFMGREFSSAYGTLRFNGTILPPTT